MSAPSGPTYATVVPSRPRVRAWSVVATITMLVLCVFGTAVAFHTLTMDRARPSKVEAALQDMEALMTHARHKLQGYGGELPIRFLTDVLRTPNLPPGALPRDFVASLGSSSDAALPRHDPWGHSYLVVATERGPHIRLLCISSGPNGHFETDEEREVAGADDLALRRDIHRAAR